MLWLLAAAIIVVGIVAATVFFKRWDDAAESWYELCLHEEVWRDCAGRERLHRRQRQSLIGLAVAVVVVLATIVVVALRLGGWLA